MQKSTSVLLNAAKDDKRLKVERIGFGVGGGQFRGVESGDWGRGGRRGWGRGVGVGEVGVGGLELGSEGLGLGSEIWSGGWVG